MTSDELASPAGNYDDMAGWPGTIPPRRLRKVAAAIRRGMPREEMDRQTREDALGMAHAQRANRSSFSEHPGMRSGYTGTEAQRYLRSLQNWEKVVEAARDQDTQQGMGGVIVWKDENRERRGLFRLLRHPEWVGLNRTLRLMQGMRVMVFESWELDLEPGLVIAQNECDDGEWPVDSPAPPGGAQLLREILLWHGAREVRWMGLRETLELREKR